MGLCASQMTRLVLMEARAWAEEGSPVCATYGGAPGAADGSGSWSEPEEKRQKHDLKTHPAAEATCEQVDSTEGVRQPEAKPRARSLGPVDQNAASGEVTAGDFFSQAAVEMPR